MSGFGRLSGAKSGASCTDGLFGRRGRPNAAEAERISDHILDTGWKLLLDQGFENFSLERLAREARTGKPTIYSRFGDKRGLLCAMLERRKTERAEQVRRMAGSLPFAEAMCRQASYVLEIMFSDEGVLYERLIDWIDEEPGGDGPTARGTSHNNAVIAIREMLAAGEQSGEVHFDDIDEAAVFWLEAMIGHARFTKSNSVPSREENERWARKHTERFLRAFARPVNG